MPWFRFTKTAPHFLIENKHPPYSLEHRWILRVDNYSGIRIKFYFFNVFNSTFITVNGFLILLKPIHKNKNHIYIFILYNLKLVRILMRSKCLIIFIRYHYVFTCLKISITMNIELITL